MDTLLKAISEIEGKDETTKANLALVKAADTRVGAEAPTWQCDTAKMLSTAVKGISEKDHEKALGIADELQACADKQEVQQQAWRDALKECSMEMLEGAVRPAAKKNKDVAELLEVATVEINETGFSPTLAGIAMEAALRNMCPNVHDPYVTAETDIYNHTRRKGSLLMTIENTALELLSEDGKGARACVRTAAEIIDIGAIVTRETSMAETLNKTGWKPKDEWSARIEATIASEASIAGSLARVTASIVSDDFKDLKKAVTGLDDNKAIEECRNAWLDAKHWLDDAIPIANAAVELIRTRHT